MIVISSPMPSRITDIFKRTSFIRKYMKKSIKEHKRGLGNYKGLWYKVNEEVIDLTLRFYDWRLKHKSNLISYYNRVLTTDKFEAYIKRNLANQIFALLKYLHLARISNIKQNKILINRNPINEFVVGYFQDKYKIKYQIRWISSGWRAFALGAYYGWLFKQCIYRGIVFNKDRKEYKISKEAAWGFYQPTLRDDILIDNDKFKKSDILILNFNTEHSPRLEAFEEAKKRGFATASVEKLKININKNIFSILFFYLWVPVNVYFQLLLSRQLYLFYYIIMFHKGAFPVEILMNSYHIKCHISVITYDDIATTIILNKYRTKNVIFHWSDMTCYKGYGYAFIAHNIYFTWGNIHYDYHADYYFVDKKINTGCIFKREYNKTVENRERTIKRLPGFKEEKKTVIFFDSSFNNAFRFTEEFFLEYLEIIKEFCKKNKDVNVFLKPKSEMDKLRISQDNYSRYKKIWNELISCESFIYLNPIEWSVEQALSISDICINMGMNSPSTIALIFGKDALYYDNTGITSHPFAEKYMNKIVFEDKNRLFAQINNILNGSFSCKDVISEGEIREYDAFEDDEAMERLRSGLSELSTD
ncbi:MAG: hypothetical protein JSV30_07235 [Candidatus Omnitrophota bacterium]|nr:MAG: hypothetical protein JSV30_07235 [Candidatus Omnitrophota bacterium]